MVLGLFSSLFGILQITDAVCVHSKERSKGLFLPPPKSEVYWSAAHSVSSFFLQEILKKKG